MSRAVMPCSVTPGEASQGAERRRERMSMHACMQAAAMGAAQPGITYDVRGVSEGLWVGRGMQQHGGQLGCTPLVPRQTRRYTRV